MAARTIKRRVESRRLRRMPPVRGESHSARESLVADTTWDPEQTCEPSAGQAMVAVAISCPIVPGFSGAAARSQSSSEVIGSQGGNHYSWLQNPKPQSGEYLRLANNWPWTVELFSGQSNFYSSKLCEQSGLLTGKCRKQGAGNRWLEIQVIQSENQVAIIQRVDIPGVDISGANNPSADNKCRFASQTALGFCVLSRDTLL
jgi:hypothetical protein